MELSAQVLKRLTRELQDLIANPAEGIRVFINEQNLTDIQAELDGPQGTPFESGVFRMRLTLPGDFPASPPKGFFITKVFHPNVSTSGDICVNVLKRDWTSETTLRHVFMRLASFY
ncbi:hypothetical protein Vafri_1249 [Volvox africanus]|nr:hypothetical protein Vafri_1249 [Volvox africanus]